MLISLFKTSFDHFQFCPTSGMTSIHYLTVCPNQVIINPGHNPAIRLLDWDWKSFLETPRATKAAQAQDAPRKGKGRHQNEKNV